MRVIITQPYLNLKGGAEEVVLRIAKRYDAKILTVEYDREKTFEGFSDLDIQVIERRVPFAGSLPYRAVQGIRAGYSFYNQRIDDDYDIINAHTSPSEWIRHLNPRVLWYCHTPIREVYDLYDFRMRNRTPKDRFLYFSFASAYKLLSKPVIKEIEGIATNSRNTNRRINRYLSRNATVINPGIDAKRFTDRGNGKYFLYHSRFYANKRQDYVIDAFSRLQSTPRYRDYGLVLSGSLSNDKEHLDYVKKLKSMNIRNTTFRFNISEEEKLRLYSRATAVLFSAVREDFGIVPLEAMASSKPIIAVNEGGPKETIINNKTGFLVNSPEEMANKMRFVIEHRSMAESMGRQGRKRVEKSYSWEVFFQKFDRLARKVKSS